MKRIALTFCATALTLLGGCATNRNPSLCCMGSDYQHFSTTNSNCPGATK